MLSSEDKIFENRLAPYTTIELNMFLGRGWIKTKTNHYFCNNDYYKNFDLTNLGKLALQIYNGESR